MADKGVKGRPLFPYFGGKSAIANVVWQRFGDVPTYIEPFFGSGAVLFARPTSHRWWDRIEIVNDLDGMVSNLWRAVKAEPDAVAEWADWPINENDLTSRHIWLVNRKENLQRCLEGDPDYYDSKIAGWWLWGMCQWIGMGWCSGKGPWQSRGGELINVGRGVQAINQRLSNLGRGPGIMRKLPILNASVGINRKLPDEDKGPEVCEARYKFLHSSMRSIANRLREVRVSCGDWSGVLGFTPTAQHGLAGIFLDPPYAMSERTKGVYSLDYDVAADVCRWAIDNGNNPKFRIALCGYDGNYKMPDSWISCGWKKNAGYGLQGKKGRGLENTNRERIWFSPHCLFGTT